MGCRDGGQPSKPAETLAPPEGSLEGDPEIASGPGSAAVILTFPRGGAMSSFKVRS